MNKVDEKRDTQIVSDAVDCLRRLLEKQMSSMGISHEGKRQMAREGLLAAYVDVAKSLHASETGNHTEELTAVRDATQKISEMRAKL